MIAAAAFALLAGLYPIGILWKANRDTSLRDAVLWSVAAWLSWFPALAFPENDAANFIALSMTGGAGVATLGARRPQMHAWNFVVVGLLGVMLLPLLEGLVIEVHSFNIERKAFMTAIVGVTLVNYAATRFWLAASIFGLACAAVAVRLFSGSMWPAESWLTLAAVGTTPWIACWAGSQRPADAFDAEWFAFRDRFGFVWGMRVLDQFNRAAANANLDVTLKWRGLEGGDDVRRNEARALLRSLTKRFLPEKS